MSEDSAAKHDAGHDHERDHGHGDDHGGAHDAQGGHDAHGAGKWVDYNALPPGPMMLPPIPGLALAGMALVLALLLGTMVNASLVLAAHEGHSEHGAGAEHGAGQHDSSEKTER